MTALEQVRGAVKALQTPKMALLTNTVSNISLKKLTILTKRLILNLSDAALKNIFSENFLQIIISTSVLEFIFSKLP